MHRDPPRFLIIYLFYVRLGEGGRRRVDSQDRTPAERIVTVTRRLKLTLRACQAPGCDRGFMGWGRQKYCSKACAVRADYHKHAEQRRAGQRRRYRRAKTEEKD